MVTVISRKRVGAQALAFLCVFTFVSLFFVAEALAQPTSGNNPPTSGNNPPTSGNSTVELKNPLKVDSIEAFLVAIIDVILVFALPIIIFFIMYAGFLFTTARGDTSQIEKAKGALLWSVVGGVIVLGAKIIVEVIQGTVTPLLK